MMMNQILKSIKTVIEKSKHVRINKANLRKICLKFNPNDGKYWMGESPVDLSKLDDKKRLNFIFVFNSINFCYWGNPKWTIEYQNKHYDGAWGMIASIGRTIDAQIPILNAKYLSTLSKNDLSEILRGNITIPLFDERLKILQENGKILTEKYQGQFSAVIEKADQNALSLLEILTNDFPSFNDSTIHDGQKVLFHKRAQLAISDIYHTFKCRGFGDLKHIDQLTAFADYKIPQSLRKLGISEYSKKLAAKIDNKIQMPEGSEEEVEIRANMI
ncbi:hypothetical protein HZC32_03565 [Candidatus Woesearchaeota archaeon]|nr:hypothetical protein [Candidatus Woesearchaeota archaeon]